MGRGDAHATPPHISHIWMNAMAPRRGESLSMLSKSAGEGQRKTRRDERQRAFCIITQFNGNGTELATSERQARIANGREGARERDTAGFVCQKGQFPC